uniref:Uncharacterized protein n=1 Tax=Ditylum brightwellii TaxID=49249 RepID=A0A6V2AUX4_9STRA
MFTCCAFYATHPEPSLPVTLSSWCTKIILPGKLGIKGFLCSIFPSYCNHSSYTSHGNFRRKMSIHFVESCTFDNNRLLLSHDCKGGRHNLVHLYRGLAALPLCDNA